MKYKAVLLAGLVCLALGMGWGRYLQDQERIKKAQAVRVRHLPVTEMVATSVD